MCIHYVHTLCAYIISVHILRVCIHSELNRIIHSKFEYLYVRVTCEKFAQNFAQTHALSKLYITKAVGKK
jgi:hypothetical protein